MNTARGMTLIEVIASMLIVSVVAAIMLPTVSTATGALTQSGEARAITDDVSFAVDRMAWLLRESPSGEVPGDLAIAAVSEDSIEFEDGTGFELAEGDLLWLIPGSDSAVLCEGVDSFEISLLSSDGVTDQSANPRRTHRFTLRVVRGGIDVRTVVFPRVRVGGNL